MSCTQKPVTADAILAWIQKATDYVYELMAHMLEGMQLNHVQIDEF